MYSKDVNDVLVAHRDILAHMHRVFARQTVLRTTRTGTVKQVLPVTDPVVAAYPLMSFEGFVTLLTATRLLGDNFTRRDAAIAFSLSRMRVSNDVDLKRWTEATHLNVSDFMEALCRCADMVTLPTDADLEPYRGDVARYLDATPAWRMNKAAEEWKTAHTQPLAPRLQRLLAVVIRRLESFLSNPATIHAARRASAGQLHAQSHLRDALAGGRRASVGRSAAGGSDA
jgi:hypothetical protein